MNFEGDFEVDAPRESVYDFLTEPDKVSQLMPDLEEYERKDETRFSAKFKAGVSYIKGTISMDFEITEKEENEFAKMVGEGSGLGSSVELVSTFTLEDSDGGTRIEWAAEADVGGKLASVGARFLKPVAEKNVKDIVEGVKEKVTA